jgi:hypothetical protein
MFNREAPVSPGAVTALAVGIFCGIAGLALAIRSLIKREDHQVKAITACLIAALFIACQGILVIGLLQQRVLAG